jgi:hypothetical protein
MNQTAVNLIDTYERDEMYQISIQMYSNKLINDLK